MRRRRQSTGPRRRADARARAVGGVHRGTRRSVGPVPRPGPSGGSHLDRLHATRPAQINRQLPDSFIGRVRQRSRCRRTGTPPTTARPSTSPSCGCARTTQHDRLGSILTNFGGPGASGLDSAAPPGPGPHEPGSPVRPGDVRPARGRAVGVGEVHRQRRPRRELRLRARPGQRRRSSTATVAISRRIGEGCVDEVRRGPAPSTPPSRPPATWTRSGRRLGDEKFDLPRLLVRHAARRGLRPALPRPRSGRWCSTARSTRSSRRWRAPRARRWASSGR